jgi:hypothetical protein
MNSQTPAYAATCILLPAAWGLLVYWISNIIEKRVLKSKTSQDNARDSQTTDDPLPLDYHI